MPDNFGDITLVIGSCENIFEGKLLFSTSFTTLHQIFCELVLYSTVIFKSIKVSDNIFQGTPSVNRIRC